MFTKILIANRGEIACRVIRTARRMGIATVAVYSDADERAPHVRLADEAVRLGPPPASESYLRADLILQAAKDTGADAIHPGYGFLSERAGFATACAEAGVTFIGPPPNAIAAMGDKIESKKLAREAGVSIVPGFVGEIEDTDHALRIAEDIGYPVMMKASAGGGGKGMRLAFNDQDVRDGFEATKREGLASFGDDRVFLEKFIQDPHHIEIQVLGDQHGTILYLGERECSIQRRHQKVVEEAPSPFVTPEMRRAMGEQAVALSRAVGYHSAGTVELIVGADRSFYFLEMNTRLQVEHPVTECITGLDLVEQMIRVAAGQKLALNQNQVTLDGWAMESRIYAEDPYRGFLPSIGRLVRYEAPEEWEADGSQVRVDDGVFEGGEVSIHYDPMIAKLITHAPTREAAMDLQIAALDDFVIEGPTTNLDFCSALMQHPRFREGRLTTGFIPEEYPDGFRGVPADEPLRRGLAGVAAFVATARWDRGLRTDGQLGDRLRPPARWQVRDGERHWTVELHGDHISVDGEELDLELSYEPGDRRMSAELNGVTLTIGVRATPHGVEVHTRGARHRLRVLPEHVAAHAVHMVDKVPPDLSGFLLCPMPGLLTQLLVTEGDRVEDGQALAVVEAMKMENILRAGRAGTVEDVRAKPGDSLAVDEVILALG